MEESEITIIKKLQKKLLKIPKSQKKIQKSDLYERINIFITIKNQDSYQRINVFINFLFEFYRVVSCSLLLLFIPQKCNNNICSFHDKFHWTNIFYGIALCFNFITLCIFCFLYFIEIKRENVLIKYLDVNDLLPYSSINIKQLLETLALDKKAKIIQAHEYYKKYANIMIYIYIINALLSGLIVSKYSIPGQTMSTFITYILFILIKFNNVYSTANSEEYIYYSAYLTSNIQFNDIDKKYKLINNENLV